MEEYKTTAYYSQYQEYVAKFRAMHPTLEAVNHPYTKPSSVITCAKSDKGKDAETESLSCLHSRTNVLMCSGPSDGLADHYPRGGHLASSILPIQHATHLDANINHAGLTSTSVDITRRTMLSTNTEVINLAASGALSLYASSNSSGMVKHIGAAKTLVDLALTYPGKARRQPTLLDGGDPVGQGSTSSTAPASSPLPFPNNRDRIHQFEERMAAE
jgi:hypothetical protein